MQQQYLGGYRAANFSARIQHAHRVLAAAAATAAAAVAQKVSECGTSRPTKLAEDSAKSPVA